MKRLSLLLLTAVLCIPVPAQAQAYKSRQYQCTSDTNKYYTGESRSYIYFSDVADLDRVKPYPKRTPEETVSIRFRHWIKKTGQFSARNSVHSSWIDCSTVGVNGYKTETVARVWSHSKGITESKRAALPRDWAYRDTSAVTAAEIAQLPKPRTRDRPAGTPALIVKTDTSIRDAAEAAQKARLRALQHDANLLAARAVRSAAASAQWKAKVAQKRAQYRPGSASAQ